MPVSGKLADVAHKLTRQLEVTESFPLQTYFAYYTAGIVCALCIEHFEIVKKTAFMARGAAKP